MKLYIPNCGLTHLGALQELARMIKSSDEPIEMEFHGRKITALPASTLENKAYPDGYADLVIRWNQMEVADKALSTQASIPTTR